MQNLLQELNTEQLKAVTHSGGPLLIVAGAGTGKTKVITTRMANLIESGAVKPNEILALTFTEKAANEMESRLDLMLSIGAYDFWISTFHAFCQRILEEHGLDIGLPNAFKLLDEVQQWILLKKNLHQFELNYYKPLGSPNKHIDSLLGHFSKCKDELITPERYLEYARNFKVTDDESEAEAKRILELANAYLAYQQLLLDNEMLDFGDLIRYTIELFEKRPQILQQYQNKFKHILVDEFQDTNYAQYELIKHLTGQKKSSGDKPKGKNKKSYPNQLVVVGDDDQSIYKFRGASLSNILLLEQDYPDIELITLTRNYRSAQGILDLAYDFIQQNNPERLENKKGLSKKLIASGKNDAHIEVLEAASSVDELNMVTNKIVELKLAHPESSWNDFVILVRANNTADAILPKLDQANIPYEYVANKGLFKKPLISEIISYLRLLENQHDSTNIFRVLTIPDFVIPPFEQAALTNFTHRKTLTLYEALHRVDEVPEITDTSKQQISKLLNFIALHSKLMTNKTAMELFVQIVEDLGISRTLMKDTAQNVERRDHLDQFMHKLSHFAESSEDKSLRAFLESLELEMQAGSAGNVKSDPSKGPELLKVMTVHAAKGLEFQYVFLISLIDQKFPSRAKKDPIPLPDELINEKLPSGDVHLQEERRLFYVAVTRAKQHLYLSWAKDYGGAKTRKPSLFLQECGLVSNDHKSEATGKVSFNLQVAPEDIVVHQNLPTNFSFSDINAFDFCPLDYKYRHYFKLPVKGAPQLSFGVTIHQVLQLITKHYQVHRSQKNPCPPLNTIKQWYKENWIEDWYNSKEERDQYFIEGEHMLNAVLDDLQRAKPNISLIEQPFTINLGEFTLKGRIDRADTDDAGNLIVVDYKTNKAPKQKNKKDVDQLRVYQLAVQERMGKNVSTMYYWHLRDNVKAEQSPATAAELDALKSKLLRTIETIRHAIKFDKFRELHNDAGPHDCKYESLL